jgi:glycosyltransferase involved in cell wall biosynthesis
MDISLVSVICLSYNHAPFIQEALESVYQQDYQPVEIVVVDDHSTDGSQEIIEDLTRGRSGIQKIYLNENKGNCRAFNKGLSVAKGSYIIDLAADDVLMTDRIRKGVECLSSLGETYGVHFSDAEYIDKDSRFIKYHYRRDQDGTLLEAIPQGDIYPELLSRYFICAPTMMIRRKVLDELNGYDESLAYEDFDFWIRSSRKYKYCFSDKSLVKKRIVEGSLSTRQYIRNSKILKSTFNVCLKAERLNRNQAEDRALARRVAYECRQALISGNLRVAMKFAWFLDRLPAP